MYVSAVINSSMQDVTQDVGVNAADDLAIAAKHRSARAFFRRRQSAPSLKQHRFHRHKSQWTAKHSKVARPRRCSVGNVELAVSWDYTMVLNMLAAVG